ncbi:MAG: efflux RND transporter permease subunit [candidate division KSB1 bacterium]|nr:efflux RND transporter permease subunit [candidate division KSB1 bacterium]
MMFRRIVSTFVKFPFYANLLIAFILIAGLVSFSNLKKSFFPETTSRIITISVFYPGASPIEMEEGITTRIEAAVRGIVGIKEITSTSSENSSRVTIETTGEYDIDEVLMEVKNAVDGISAMPSAAERPVIYKQRNTSRAAFVTLSGPDDIFTLHDYAYRIEDDLLNSGVISQVNLWGLPTPEISVEVSESDLIRYDLTLSEIASAVLNNNRDFSGGQIKSKNEEMLIRLRSRSADPDKIGNIVLRGSESGAQLRIRDVAVVKKQTPQNFYPTFGNGKKSITFSIDKLPEEDLEAITDYMNNYVEEFNSTHSGVEMRLIFSFFEVLSSRLNVLLNNGLIGFCLVLLTLTLFLNFRVSAWVAWGIPAFFLAMFILANAYGITINMMSLFGMILVIGILVDDGIVIGENIFHHFEQGKNPRLAAVEGTMEVAPAVVTSVLTTVVAFAPLLFMQGTQFEAQWEMAFIVIVSLLLSLVEAFFILPAHLGNEHVLRRRKPASGFSVRKYTERGFSWLREHVYVGLLKFMLKWRWVMIGVPAALLMITMGLFLGGFINSTFFPVVDFDSFEINIAFVPGSGEEQTYDYLHQFEAAVKRVDQQLMDELGMDEPVIDDTRLRVGSAFSGREQGAHAGRLMVWPRDLTNMELTGMEIAERVRREIGPVPEAEKYTVGGRNRWGSPVSISLLSRNLEALDSAKIMLMAELEEMPILKDIVDNNAQGKQEIRLHLKPRAYFLGLNQSDIARQVREGFFGGQAQRLQEGREELRVWVRYPPEDRRFMGQLERMKIKTRDGEYPLIELADYSIERGPVSIQRYNGQREVRVDADLVDPYASVPDILSQITRDIVPDIQAQYPGIRVLYQGQQKESMIAANKLRSLFIIAFAVIILIIMIHFKSFEQAAIVLLMIPLSLLGAFWGHWLHGKPVSMLSILGMVALTGVIVNDAVIFLSKYNNYIASGAKIKQAIIETGKNRLRPIVLTTLTTTIGLYPLILEKSFQAQFLIPMAISLAYGVAFGTLFILIFFPVLIHILNDIRRLAYGLWNKKTYEPEQVEVAVLYSERHIE